MLVILYFILLLVWMLWMGNLTRLAVKMYKEKQYFWFGCYLFLVFDWLASWIKFRLVF